MTRLLFENPDHAIEAHFRAQEAAGVPKTQSLGQPFNQYRPRCGNRRCRRSGTRRERMGRTGLESYCSRCGASWPFDQAYTLAGQVASSGRAPSALERSADLSTLVRDLLEAPSLNTGKRAGYANVYLCYLANGTLSTDSLAEKLTETEFLGRRWSRSRVWEAIRFSRDWVEAELLKRGLMERARFWGAGTRNPYRYG